MAQAATAQEVLDREFLELRARVLEVAAALDRLERAGGSLARDPRRAGIDRAIEVLRKPGTDRAEQVQLIFSRPYDEGWRDEFGLKPR